MFVSYSRGDADATKAIASELQQLGQTVWLDAQLSGGQQWWNTILEQIRRCDAARRGSTELRVEIPHLLAGVTEVAGASLVVDPVV